MNSYGKIGSPVGPLRSLAGRCGGQVRAWRVSLKQDHGVDQQEEQELSDSEGVERGQRCGISSFYRGPERFGPEPRGQACQQGDEVEQARLLPRAQRGPRTPRWIS